MNCPPSAWPPEGVFSAVKTEVGDDRDPRDALIRDLDLPREERELVVDRDRVYELNGEDSRVETVDPSSRTPGPSPT